MRDDQALFEQILLEEAQAGCSWYTILKKGEITTDAHLSALIPGEWLAYVALRTPPMPERLLKLGLC